MEDLDEDIRGDYAAAAGQGLTGLDDAIKEAMKPIDNYDDSDSDGENDIDAVWEREKAQNAPTTSARSAPAPVSVPVPVPTLDVTPLALPSLPDLPPITLPSLPNLPGLPEDDYDMDTGTPLPPIAPSRPLPTPLGGAPTLGLPTPQISITIACT